MTYGKVCVLSSLGITTCFYLFCRFRKFLKIYVQEIPDLIKFFLHRNFYIQKNQALFRNFEKHLVFKFLNCCYLILCKNKSFLFFLYSFFFIRILKNRNPCRLNSLPGKLNLWTYNWCIFALLLQYHQLHSALKLWQPHFSRC